MTERKIIIGLITSTDYLKQIRNIWDIKLISDVTAKRIASWAWSYFEKYDKAPGKNIEAIFREQSKGLPKAVIDEIENEILPSLSEEYTNEDFNLEYYLDLTRTYFTERRLVIHSENIQALVDNGKVVEAEKLACEYKPVSSGSETDLDLSDEIVLERVEKAFKTTNNPVLKYPHHLGAFWNSQFVKGSLVALMASEKRGKTFLLMDIAIRSCKDGKKVAFFQAGDMTEAQLLKRMCVYLAGKSDQAKYCVEHYEPVRDCIHNQLSTCDKKERECNFGVFEDRDEKWIRGTMSLDDLIEAYDLNKNYRPCFNCRDYRTKKIGTIWLDYIPKQEPLTSAEAKEMINQFFILNQRQFKLSSHSNDSLTIKQVKASLAIWEKQDNFVPDMIVIDYADLLTVEEKMEERPKQNKIWKGLRNLSQEKGQPCVVTATQADAASYTQKRLHLKNFSEDKRKYAHCTAMYGLNQDPDGREKKLGIMRINELVIREGDFSVGNEVTIMQNIRRGCPFLGCFL
jgi:hypothetical protein